MSLLEWARRRAGLALTPRPLDELAAGVRATVQRTGLTTTTAASIRSFYDLVDVDATEPMVCKGTACAFAEKACANGGRHVYCLGRCYEAPARSDVRAEPIPCSSMAATPVVLRHILGGEAPLDDYRLPSGEEILDAVVKSGLRGRGGAAFPTGAKWQTARRTPAVDRYVVANGDEGDPGAFVDRLLLEEAPHAVLAGMAACARAIVARRGIVFIRGEYPAAAEAMRRAIAEAKERGLLGDFDVRVLTGAGSYVAGEETALLRSIEGLRAEPWPKPPYPAERGLDGLPTIVQNVETLAVVPWVVRTKKAAGNKAVCLSGAIRRPGVVEIELGTPLRSVLEQAGGGAPNGRTWKMALVGGPMGRVVGAAEFDVKLSFDDLPGMGHGGITLFDTTVGAGALAMHLFEFARQESCGNCTPCRVGTAQLATRRTRADLERLFLTLEQGGLCGFGQGVPRPLRDLLRLFPGEMLS